jgi:hypothetical protein
LHFAFCTLPFGFLFRSPALFFQQPKAAKPMDEQRWPFAQGGIAQIQTHTVGALLEDVQFRGHACFVQG